MTKGCWVSAYRTITDPDSFDRAGRLCHAPGASAPGTT